MSTTATKLTYLNDTKQLLKENINSLGGNLTTEPFRQYASVLEGIYERIPKVSGIGSNLSLSPTMAGKIKLNEIQGNTLQDGTPSPSSPVEIQSVTGLQNVTISNSDNTDSNTYEVNLGKNLFNSSVITNSKITISEDETLNVSDVGSANGYCETGKTLSQLCPNLKVGDIVYLYIDTDFYYNDSKRDLIYCRGNWTNGTSKTITQDMLNGVVVIYGGYEETSHIKIMITKSLDTNYSPYFTPIELNKIGTYQDRIYKDNGKWYVEKNIGKVLLDGSENWTDGSTNIFNVEDILPPHTYSTYSVNVLCDSYLGIIGYASNSAFVSGTTNIDYACSLHSNGTTIRFKDIRYTSKEDLKTWLGTHNAALYFQLATPTTTEITNTELIEDLETLYTAKSKEGTTNISIISENLPMIISASALKSE